MHEPIIVADPNQENCDELCKLLRQHQLQSLAVHSLTELQKKVDLGACRVLILDLDNLPVDNRFFRNASKQNPRVQILGISSRSFHPELREAMSQHIVSCLSKPVEEEELLFWVKSLLRNIDETAEFEQNA